jgi:hypothetical protein
VQLAELLLGDVDLLQRGGDLVECQEAPFLTIRDQRPKLVQLVDRRLVRQQNIVLDRSAPLGFRSKRGVPNGDRPWPALPRPTCE